MVITYSDCLERWKSDYQIKKQIADGKLYQIEKGVYADTPDVSILAILSSKYPKAVFTMDSAFYYHGLTDVIPDEYHIATDRHSMHLSDKRIRQYYIQSDIFEVGVTTMTRRDATFRIYDRERMLIELLRYKKSCHSITIKRFSATTETWFMNLILNEYRNMQPAFPDKK